MKITKTFNRSTRNKTKYIKKITKTIIRNSSYINNCNRNNIKKSTLD